MSTHYVIKTAQRLYFFYRGEYNGLMCRTLEQGRLSQENCLMKSIRRFFTVTLAHDEPQIFCQDDSGSLWLVSERAGVWNNRVMNPASDAAIPPASEKSDSEADPDEPLYNEGDTARHRHDVMIAPLFTGKGLCMVYNTLSTDGSGHYLVMRLTNGNGEWPPPSRIDKYQPLNHIPYEVQATSKEHMLLYYQTRTTENQLGYREITPAKVGPYQRFYNGAGTVADTAYLTTNDAVHVLYIVKTFFSCQLLYRRRTEAVFSTPLLLWEAPRIDQALLSFAYDNLYATCMIGGQLYMAVSENKGVSFTRMALYKSKFCYDPVKAVFLSSIPLAENDLYVRQVYVDRNAPWDTQMIPDLYGDFYTFPEPETEMPLPAPTDALRDLQDRLLSAQRQLEERDHQIMRLMMKMKTTPETDV